MFMNPPFPRPAEPPIKPQYIVLFKGDDSDFQGNQSVDVVIDTELDTTGMKAHFRFMDFVQDFDSIPENKTLSLVFPNAKTSEFPLGAADATLRLEDASGKFRTISNRIHIVVTNSVHEAYDNEDIQSITVTVKGTVTWDMIEGKPPIPDPVTIDPALSTTSENPVQNKAVAAALAGKRDVSDLWIRGVPSLQTPGWFACNGVLSERGTGPWQINLQDTYLTVSEDLEFQYTVSDQGGNSAAIEISSSDAEFDATVVLGGVSYRVVGIVDEIAGSSDVAEKQDALSSAQMAAVNSGATAAKVATWDGYAAQIAAKANATDVNAALAQKASSADLPYALVTPGEWTFSDDNSYAIDIVQDQLSDFWVIRISSGTFSFDFDGYSDRAEAEAVYAELSTFTFTGIGGSEVTATRPSLPGHLCDRAGNRVVVTGDTTLTLPALTEQGKLRDFLVRLEISGSTVPTITFSPDGNESVTYETDGDEFPVPDEAGTWLYSFTESCVAHRFAVSLKKVNTVAQGGS